MVRLIQNITKPVAALLLLALLPTERAEAQSAEEVRLLFTEAEMHFLYEEYDQATTFYSALLSISEEDNGNILYKLGYCYLNIPAQRSMVIPILERASAMADPNADPESFRETNAPLDVWFALGTAYRINNELEKAIDAYQKFLRLSEEAGHDINVDFVNHQIASCRNAQRLKDSPAEIYRRNLGPEINQQGDAVKINPVVSFDGNSMVFTGRRGLDYAIFYTIKERGEWQPPVDITHQLGGHTDCIATSLNADGTELYLYKDDDFEGNIYVSKLSGGSWSEISKLNRNINTRYFESHAAISCDGQRLYFASNRPGGYGGLDIYVSERGRGDRWGRAVNLGPTINTPYNETSPFVIRNDSILFFASEGHTTMGGYDIFMSRKVNDDWRTPENPGYPLNTTDDDDFFQPKADATGGYISSYTAGYMARELYEITFGEMTDTEFRIMGLFSLADTTVRYTADNYSIQLVDNVSGDTLDIAFPNEFTGIYTLYTGPGDYQLIYKGRGYFPVMLDTTITAFNPETIIRIDITLQPDPDFVDEPPVEFPEPVVLFERIDLSAIPQVAAIDSAILRTDITIGDLDDPDIDDDDILYYTVQVMALYNPVDVSYFRHIDDIVVVYNEKDRFYRYTTGVFETREEAASHRTRLIEMGYPDEIFIKKVLRE